ncbi:ATP-dependent DNA helicase UvrD2 [soil metagenome]
MSVIQDAIDELNAEQLRAFGVDGDCVVVAPPGSGKTRLLVTRMASDLDRVEAPRGVACITLTNSAALEIHDRFDQLSSDSRSNLFIGTVHAFALTRIVRPFAVAVGQPALATAGIASARQTSELWKLALDDANIRSDAQSLLWTTVRRYRNAMATEEEWNGLGRDPIAARDAYFARLEEANLLDFGRIVEHAASMVENQAPVRKALRATFKRIYVDEYQDLAPALDRIIRALCFHPSEEGALVFAVGDADQAIYGWTGTDSRLLRELAALPSVTAIPLTINYRNGEHILALSRRLFPEAGVVATASRSGGTVIAERIQGGIVGQAAFAARSITDLADQGAPFHEIAVLGSTNAIAVEVATQLELDGTPAWVKINEEWETPLTIGIERLATWVGHGRDSSGFKINTLAAELRRMVPGVNDAFSGRLIASALGARPDSAAVELVDDVLSLLTAGRNAQDVDALHEEVSAFMTELRSGSLAGLSVAELGARRVFGERVHVTTLSSSKGLEFDHVFIVGLEDGRIPFFTSFDSPKEMEEERNKFYVAMTRARKSVTLLWSGYTVDKYNRRRENPVSRFVRDLGKLS